MKISKYTFFYSEHEKHYIYHQVSNSLICVDYDLYYALYKGNLNSIPENITLELTSKGFIIDENNDESTIIKYANLKNRYNSKCMRITILPTLNCNFHCWYCYENHQSSAITTDGLEAIMAFIKKETQHNAIKYIILDWFGGEPLLYFNKAIYPFSKALKEWTDTEKIKLLNIMTTNGSLITESMTKCMNEIGLRQLQITLDGYKEYHNKTRYSAQMKNSFDVIVKNIHTICHNIDNACVELRINYTHANISSAMNILDCFDKTIRKNITISPHVVWQEASALKDCADEVYQIKNKAFKMGYNITNTFLKHSCMACYVENMEQFVINYDLNVYKCTARDFDIKSSVGKITNDGQFIPNDNYYKYYITSSSFINDKCLNCEILPSCMNENLCIQKVIEKGITECNKESIKEAIKLYIKNKINRHIADAKAFMVLLFIIVGFCNVSYGQEQNDTTISYNKELDEVTVVASHTEIQKNGDIMVNIQNNPIAEGKSTMEMLNYIKGVNATDNGITILGREGTIVYLDNRVTTINELRTISPDMIAKVIVSPHAATRYGINSTGGVIHIVLKKTWGLIGSLSVRNQYDTEGYVDTYPFNSMLYRTGKHSVYNSISIGYGNYNTSDESTYLKNDETDNYYSKKNRREMPFYDNIGYIYNFTDDDYINIYGGAGFSHVKSNYQSNSNNENLEIYNRDNNTSYSGGIEYKKFFNNDKYKNSFTVNATYNGYTTNLNQTYMLGKEDKSKSRQHLNSYTIIPEISLNMKGQQTLNAGFAMYMLSDNNYYDGINNSLLDQVVKRDYRISGLAVRPWVEYSKTLGQRLYMRIGMEYYNGGNKHKDRIDAANNYNTTNKGFYPNVLFQWWPDKNFKSCMSFSYRHYYSLPDYGYYSPVAVYTSDNMYSVGNTKLVQETFDSFEMNYYLGNNWVFTYRMILGHDIIRIISHYDSNKEMFYTMPDNAGSSNAHRISAAWNGYIMKKWYSKNTLSYNFSKEKMPGKYVSRPYMYFNSSNQYKISDNAGITMELYAISKTENLNYEKDWMYFVDPGIFVTLLKKKLSLNLTASNLLHNQFGKIKINGNGYEIRRIDKTHITRFILTAIWNFKSGKEIKDIKRNSINQYKKITPVL